MCGRFVITSPPAALRQIFGYTEQPNFPPRHNIAPTQPIPVVILENGIRHFRLMRWGLLPAWVKDPRKFTLLINARAETVLEKPAFKNAIKRRRCLIPADGYYEWQASGKRKRPHFIHRRDGAPDRACGAGGNLDRPERRGTRHRGDRHRAGERRSRGAASPRARDDCARLISNAGSIAAHDDAEEVMALLTRAGGRRIRLA